MAQGRLPRVLFDELQHVLDFTLDKADAQPVVLDGGSANGGAD